MAKTKWYDLGIMDFSKAFDVVPHKHHFEKLQYYGIKGQCLDWIEDFFKNRQQRIAVDGECFEEAAVTSGVPQGSVLGPICFLASAMTSQSMLPPNAATYTER